MLVREIVFNEFHSTDGVISVREIVFNEFHCQQTELSVSKKICILSLINYCYQYRVQNLSMVIWTKTCLNLLEQEIDSLDAVTAPGLGVSLRTVPSKILQRPVDVS